MQSKELLQSFTEKIEGRGINEIGITKYILFVTKHGYRLVKIKKS
jgi:hypothetical protein